MKVKLILEKEQPIAVYDDSYGNRLIEQGKAVYISGDKPAEKGKAKKDADA